jgi:hypothetical protein
MHRTHATSSSKRARTAAPHNLMQSTRQHEQGASSPSSNHACVRRFAAGCRTCSSRALSSACNSHRMGTADLSRTPGRVYPTCIVSIVIITKSSYKQWSAHQRGAAVARKGLRLCQAARRAAGLFTAFEQLQLHVHTQLQYLSTHCSGIGASLRFSSQLMMSAARIAFPPRLSLEQSTPSSAGAFMPPVSQHCDHAGFRFRSNAPAPYAHRLAADALVPAFGASFLPRTSAHYHLSARALHQPHRSFSVKRPHTTRPRA